MRRWQWTWFMVIATGVAGTRIGQAATNIVSNLRDGLTAGTLRLAIENSAPGDIIIFSNGLAGTISLTNGGQLRIRRDLTIQGPGAKLITISGNSSNRVFNITNANVSISGLTIANGLVRGTNGISGAPGETVYGAGLLKLDSAFGYVLTISNCVYLQNTAIGGAGSIGIPAVGAAGGSAYGAALFNNGPLVIRNCSFAGNSVIGGNGGFGSFNGGAGGTALGGAVWNIGIASLTNCTFVTNSAVGGAGGNIGGNIGGPGTGGSGEGGALYNAQHSVVVSCTISSNSVIGGEGGKPSPGGVGPGRKGGAYGGGLRTSSGIFEIGNSLVAGNTGAQARDISGDFTSRDFNLVGATNGGSGFGATFDQTGTTNSQINALLEPFRDNGGPTPTFALQVQSPAVDSGFGFGSVSDQRGAPRPSGFPGTPVSADGSDIGAYELVAPLLKIDRTRPSLLLSWSVFNSGFALQSTTNLTSANWANVGATPSVSSARFYVTNAILNEDRFFRLHSPLSSD